MGLEDTTTVIDLITRVSVFGLLFIFLVLLPLFVTAVYGVLKVSGLQMSWVHLVLSALLLLLALASLKLGIEQEKELHRQAQSVKQYLVSRNWKVVGYERLGAALEMDSGEIDEVVERYPDSFTRTRLQGSDSIAVLLTEPDLVAELDEMLVSLASTKIPEYLGETSLIGFDDVAANVDSRFDYVILEKLVVRYPERFRPVNMVDERSGLRYVADEAEEGTN